jgi:hypothetical protein
MSIYYFLVMLLSVQLNHIVGVLRLRPVVVLTFPVNLLHFTLPVILVGYLMAFGLWLRIKQGWNALPIIINFFLFYSCAVWFDKTVRPAAWYDYVLYIPMGLFMGYSVAHIILQIQARSDSRFRDRAGFLIALLMVEGYWFGYPNEAPQI